MLGARVADGGGRSIALEQPGSGGGASLEADAPISFQLLADVAAPDLRRGALSATHVAVSGALAYVTYATPGEAYGGAVGVFDVSAPVCPVLVSSARFDDTDVNALA